MFRFRKVTSKNLKIKKFSVTLATSNFQELFVMKFDSKSSQFEIPNLLLKGFITKKRKGRSGVNKVEDQDYF